MGWFKNSHLNESENLKILDVGSLDSTGEYNYKNIFNEPNWEYVGLDIEDGNNVDLVVNDIYNWFEIEDESYDVVISGQFFQHLKYFWLTMAQIERVLKPNGHVCIIVPSAGHNYDKNMPDCYRFNKGGLRALTNYAGLEIIRLGVDKRELAKPWYDSYVFAKKKNKNTAKNTKNLEKRMNLIEDKLDNILNNIQK